MAQDTQVLDKNFLLVSLLIRDARTGQFIAFNKDDEECVRSYAIYTNRAFSWLMKLCIAILLILVLFEEPSLPKMGLPLWGTLTIEFLCLLFLCFRLVHRQKFSHLSKLTRDPRYIAAWVIVGLTVVDIILNLAWLQFSPSNQIEKLPRLTRVLRPALCLCFPIGSEMFRIFRNIRRSLPDVLALLAILMFGISFFAIMSTKLFAPRKLVYSDGSAYMPNFFDAWWDFYVLVTTANNPDVMLPAYDYSQWRALLFIFFLMLVMYIFMNLTLATLYNNYKENLKEDVQLLVYKKRFRLAEAFELLKEWHASLQTYVVSEDTWTRLITYMDKSMDNLKMRAYFVVMTDGEPHISKSNFLFVADLLNEPLVQAVKDPTCCERTCGACYTSPCSNLVRKIVKSKIFRYSIDFLIVVNTVTIAMDYNKLEWGFLAVFTVEMVLKMYTFGIAKFFKSAWNWLDALIITAAIAVTVALELSGAEKKTEVDYVESILVLRLLRLLRLLGVVNRFKIIFRTIVKTVPSLVSYSIVVVIFYYIYSILGMEIFKYRIEYNGYADDLEKSALYCGNPSLKNSEFFIKRYCNLHFNNFFSSFIVLFTLMVVNQWHVIAQGYELVTNKYSRLYFITFHIFVVIILMNIFTGIVLEVFSMEYQVKDDNRVDSAVHKKIRKLGLAEDVLDEDEDEGEKEPLTKETQARQIAESYGLQDVKFRLKSSGRKSTIQIMQAMFEGELDADDTQVNVSGELSKADKQKLKLLEKAKLDF